MYAVPQHSHTLRLPYNVHICEHRTASRIHISASITTITTTQRRRNPELVVVKPPHVPTLPTLGTSAPHHVADDLSLRSTWAHRAWVASGCTSVLVSLLKSVMGAIHSGMSVEPLLMGLVGYILADLGTGVYHWAIDNYGDASTPIFGPQIEAFQGHHKWPWTITRRQFANNLHALARATTFALVPMDLAISDAVVHALVGVCGGCVMFSQQFHAWAHGTKSRLPPLVVALQDSGVLISRAKHGAHHRAPYNNNYCIVSGVWNGFLDDLKFFEAMEMVVFFRYGVRPRSWAEPNSDWAEETDPPLASEAVQKERVVGVGTHISCK